MKAARAESASPAVKAWPVILAARVRPKKPVHLLHLEAAGMVAAAASERYQLEQEQSPKNRAELVLPLVAQHCAQARRLARVEQAPGKENFARLKNQLLLEWRQKCLSVP